MAKPQSAARNELRFQGKADLATLKQLVKAVDKSPATTWGGTGGAKERILKLIADQEALQAESTP